MAHDKNKGGTAVQEAEQVQNEVVAEEPKTKVGDKAAETTVDKAAAGEKKARGAAIRDTATFRLLDGVDASKFNGQRGCVVRAMQKLHKEHGLEKHFSIKQIVDNVEGLVTRTPLEASVTYHLKGLHADGQVVSSNPEPAKPAEKKDEKAA